VGLTDASTLSLVANVQYNDLSTAQFSTPLEVASNFTTQYAEFTPTKPIQNVTVALQATQVTGVGIFDDISFQQKMIGL
jgi:hypothetical protein